MPEKKPTLRDIANVVNVSRMTVSMALKNDPRVAAKTKEQIRKVAQELGYQPNPQLGKLMAEMARTKNVHKRMGELAFITSSEEEFGWKESYHLNNCFKGAKEQAEKLGYDLTAFWSLNRKFEGNRLSEILWSRGIEGVIIAPPDEKFLPSLEATLKFDWKRFCNVRIDVTFSTPTLHIARHNHFYGMMLCLEKLELSGYQRIGLVLSKKLDLQSNHSWSSAYVYWRILRKKSNTLPGFIFEEEINKGKLANWLKDNKIEAVISVGKRPLEALQELQIKIPEELGFASLDINNQDKDVSGIDQMAKEIGVAAVDDVVQSIRKGLKGIPEVPRQILINGEWQEGRTIRKIREVEPPKRRLVQEMIKDVI